MTDAQLETEKTAIEAQLAAYNAAFLALAASPKAYSLNTGQTTTTVTRNDFDKMNAVVKSLRNQLDIICLRLDGGGTMIGRPLC